MNPKFKAPGELGQDETDYEVGERKDCENRKRFSQEVVVQLICRIGELLNADDVAERRLFDGRDELANHAGNAIRSDVNMHVYIEERRRRSSKYDFHVQLPRTPKSARE